MPQKTLPKPPPTILADPSRQAAKLSTLSTFQKGIQVPMIGDG